MRLHTLHLQAFGPFAAEHTVDFDTLSGDGLFLLHGDTGAGKTTLFAAICVALYGAPPTDRKLELRSDHARADLLTEVTLEATIAGKRLRVRRIPAQRKQKVRGEGTTVQKAETYLSQWSLDAAGQGRWEALSKSHKEAADEIEGLLGMSRQQFCQVVLLPQNEFTKFLRADATNRRDLLGKLFRTHRFGAIEKWLTVHKNTVTKQREEARADVLSLVVRIQQEAGEDLEPEQDAPRASDPATLTGPAVAWATALHARATADVQEATTLAGLAVLELEAFRSNERTVRELATHQEAHRIARRQLDGLEEQSDRQAQLHQQRQQALRGQKLAPLLHAAAAAAVQHVRAQEDEEAARTLLDPEHATLDPAQLATAGQRLHTEIGALRALLPDEATLQQCNADLHKLDDERQGLAEDLRDTEAWLTDIPARRAELHTRLDTARTAQESAREHTAALTAVAGRLEAAKRRDAHTGQIKETEQRLLVAQAATQEAALAHIDIRRRRTDGMAAELALQLIEGEPCMVCGSPTHPDPAAPHPDQPTAADEQAAETLHTHTREHQQTIHDELRDVGEKAATARGEAGGDTSVDDLTAEHTDLQQHREQALEAAADTGSASEQLEVLERQHTQKSSDRSAVATRLAATDARYDRLAIQTRELEQKLTDARADASTLTQRITQLTQTADRLTTAAETAAATARTTQEHAQATEQAEAAAREAGFETRDSAERSLLSDDALQALEEEINQWREQHAAAAARLSEPHIRAAATQPPADPAEALAQLNAATTRHTNAAVRAGHATQRTHALADLLAQLTTHTQRLEPLEHTYRTADHLHSLINGTSPSNKLRMELEAYVLTARLEEVVKAANTRLTRMSEHRYTLVYSDDRASNNARSGLGLKITDAWTGKDRNTDTLSGGESFFASLSLALGLADVVTAESGGQALDTLFIDEGFGTLDEDTLHHVLDVLDSLRAHDRTVGVISHVPELRRRITHRLHVRKTATGSTLLQLTETAQ